MHPQDALREIEKVVDALERVGRHAELHLADTVRYAPLTVTALNARDSALHLRDYLTEQAGR